MARAISETYSFSYLIQNPITKPIMEKHLNNFCKSINMSLVDLTYVSGTLKSMFAFNMGGGLPHEIVTALMRELDEVPVLELQTLK